MSKYAINADLTISFLNEFSSQDGDEVAWGIDEAAMLESHPHAIALKSALSKSPWTHDYTVGYASASCSGPVRICLTCTNPDDGQEYTAEHRKIVTEAGLDIVNGTLDEAGDHALVG